MLIYALQRRGDTRSVTAAERAWPTAVSPARASAFDMIGAAYALRTLALGAATRERLAAYLAAYPGHVPARYSNLTLVEALAAIATSEAGVPSPRLAQALRTVNVTVPRVVTAGGYLSDPRSFPLAYHALSTLMLAEAVTLLGPRASPAARRTLRATLDTLSVLVAPDGAADYLGRGQGNVWVPAVTVAAMLAGAALVPARAARYLGVARVALARLRALHLTADRGLLVVPGARAGYDGIDPYVHTVAYNGLALWALAVAAERAAGLTARAGPAPAERPLRFADRAGSGLAVVSTGGTWMAVRALRRGGNSDLRSGFGLLALKVRDGLGWRDLLAPRPRVKGAPFTPAPALGRAAPAGTDVDVRGATIRISGAFGERRARFAFRARAGGAELEVAPVRRGDRLRLEVYTPAGSGEWDGRERAGGRGPVAVLGPDLRAPGTRPALRPGRAARRAAHRGPPAHRRAAADPRQRLTSYSASRPGSGGLCTVLRSGTSFSSQASTKATSVTAAPTMKTGCSASTNACRNSSRITGSSAWTWSGLMFTPPPRRAATSPGSRSSSCVSREAKIAPNSATPSEPPMERKNVAVEVATPMSRGGASFWTTSTITCITSPIPTPSTSM